MYCAWCDKVTSSRHDVYKFPHYKSNYRTIKRIIRWILKPKTQSGETVSSCVCTCKWWLPYVVEKKANIGFATRCIHCDRHSYYRQGQVKNLRMKGKKFMDSEGKIWIYK